MTWCPVETTYPLASFWVTLTVPEIGGYTWASQPVNVAVMGLEVEPIFEVLYPVLWSDNEPSARAIALALSAVYFLAWAT